MINDMYIIITQSFALAMDGKKSNVTDDEFNYTVTKDGRYVTAYKAYDNFKTDFDNAGIANTPVVIPLSDFDTGSTTL